jgi:AraC-like DNA-binding protein
MRRRAVGKHFKPRHAVARPPSFAERTSPLDNTGGPMGIRLAPLREGDTLTLRAAFPSLVVPTDAGVIEATRGSATHSVDGASFLLLPVGGRATVRAKSPIAHVLVLSITPELQGKLLATYPGEVVVASVERYFSRLEVLPRTNWMNEICHRYLFERAVCKKQENDATRFLETEIVKEVYFLCRERDTSGDRPSVVEGEKPLVQRALKVIEAHLFEADVVLRLPELAGASASTLLRTFKKELGQGPLAYVRARRLDEAVLLLKSKRFTVSEVALRVGYKNFAAFSAAFRSRFGKQPREVRTEARSG